MRAVRPDPDLGHANTSMTINATAPWLLALYVAAADEQGAPPRATRARRRTISSGISVARHLHLPAGPSLRLITDMIGWTTRRTAEVEPDECLFLPFRKRARDRWRSGLRAGDGDERAERAPGRSSIPADKFVPRRSGASRSSSMRASSSSPDLQAQGDGRTVGRALRGRYGVTDPKLRLFRYGVQVNSLGLTEPQPENNVYRILFGMLGVTLSKKARACADVLPGTRRWALPASVGPAMVAAPTADRRLRDRHAGL